MKDIFRQIEHMAFLLLIVAPAISVIFVGVPTGIVTATPNSPTKRSHSIRDVGSESAWLVDTIVWSHDGRSIARATAEGIRLYKMGALDTPELFELPPQYEQVWSLAFSADDSVVVAGSEPGRLWLWDAQSKKLQRTLQAESEGNVITVAFRQDGTLQALIDMLGLIEVWAWNSKDNKGTLLIQDYGVRYSVFSADGKALLVSRSSYMQLWSTKPLAPIQAFQTYEPVIATVSPDLSLVASNNGGTMNDLTGQTVWLFDTQTGLRVKALKGHTARIITLAFSSDSKLLATGAQDATIRLWDIKTRQTVRILQGHLAGVEEIAFSADGKMLAALSSVDWGKSTFSLWNVETGVYLGTF